MKSLIVAILALAIAVSNAFGTAQIPDVIIYGGKEYMLHTNPMEAYFERHPDIRPESESMSTNLWRGYVATFEARGDRIYLKDIEVEETENDEEGVPSSTWRSTIGDVVGENEKLKIDWFTGILVLPHGELKNYVHMGYASSFSDYMLLEVEKGVVRREMNLNADQYEDFKDKQFAAFRKTREYQNLVKKLDGEFESPEFLDSFLRSAIIRYTSKFLDE